MGINSQFLLLSQKVYNEKSKISQAKLSQGKFYKPIFANLNMNIEVVKEEKNEIEIRLDNTTIAEVLRVYLYDAGAEYAAWRREHPSKPAIMVIKAASGKTVKKVVSDAIAAIKKDASALASVVGKK